MEVLLLRFDAPLMSFGATVVDHRGVIQPYPALSMICGLLGNALGYDHRDSGALQQLQERIRYASRADRRGTRLRDYQRVDLGQPFMLDELAWTTRGELEKREGQFGKGITLRYRDYWADAAHTVAVALEPADDDPDLKAVAGALVSPERPLFIGRKPCLPAGPILLGRTETGDLLEALRRAPLAEGADSAERLPAWWPTELGDTAVDDTTFARPATGARDWANQIHVGERWMTAGALELAEEGGRLG